MTFFSSPPRRVMPELLETLSPDDPVAIRSRRDLKWVNAIMGNHRWLAKQLKEHLKPDETVLELAAGDGVLGAHLVQQGICKPGQLHGADLIPRPALWPEGAGWTEGNLLEMDELPAASIVITSLFLHHLQDDELGSLAAKLPARCRMLLAVEPARREWHRWQGRFFCLLANLHPVTRHDMQVSIGAGFKGTEVADVLGLQPDWETRARLTFFGAYQFVAWKLSSPF